MWNRWQAKGHVGFFWYPTKSQKKFNTAQLEPATYRERERELGFWVVLTVIGHVEGGEAGVGVAKHSLNGVVSIDSAPSPTGLPHSVEDSAYVEGIVPVGESDSLSLLCSHGAALHARSGPSTGGGGVFDMREIGKDRFYSGCHCHCHFHCCVEFCVCVVRTEELGIKH